MDRKQLQRPPFGPRHWLSWLAVGLMWVLGRMPRRAGLALVRPLGPLMRVAMKRRREVAQRNLERCFPEWDDAHRQQVLRDSFDALARALVETAWCWSGAATRMLDRVEFSGLEHLLEAEERGRGVLLVTAHFTSLEIGGRFVCDKADVTGVYRKLENPVFEWYQNRGRLSYARGMIDKNDMRAVIRLLRHGGVLWYAPDQDFGPRESAFAPFFGIPTASLLATHRLPRMTGCSVLMMRPVYDVERDRYRVIVEPALDDFPGDDPVEDLARVNAILEAQIRQAPEQYWWVHRRFKTRPDGEAPFYD